MSANPNQQTIIRRKNVESRTGLSRSTIYAKFTPDPKRPRSFDPTFPKPIRLGAKAIGWISEEIDQWIADQVKKTRGDQA